MSDLKKFPKEISEALYNCKELTEDQLLLLSVWLYSTPALQKDSFWPSLSLKQSEGCGSILLPYTCASQTVFLSARSLRTPPNIVLPTSRASR